MRPGDTVLLRSVYGGRVRWTFPHVLVELTARAVVLYLPPGALGKVTPRGADGYLKRWAGGADPSDHVWHGGGVLWEASLGAAHMIGHFWDEHGAFLGWYLNLQEPLRPTGRGFDTCDQVLDVWVEPDGTWAWKDEHELAEAIDLGIYSTERAREIRAEGERVLGSWPFPTGWENWQPDPSWPIPVLPDDWDRVEPAAQ